MRNTLILAGLIAATLAPVAASAQPGHNRHHSRYDSRGRYAEPHRITRNDHVWRGRDGKLYCKRDNGTTGLVIGAAAGALVGRELDGGRDRTLGTILGAAAGGLLGREVDKGDLKCR